MHRKGVHNKEKDYIGTGNVITVSETSTASSGDVDWSKLAGSRAWIWVAVGEKPKGKLPSSSTEAVPSVVGTVTGGGRIATGGGGGDALQWQAETMYVNGRVNESIRRLKR